MSDALASRIAASIKAASSGSSDQQPRKLRNCCSASASAMLSCWASKSANAVGYIYINRISLAASSILLIASSLPRILPISRSSAMFICTAVITKLFLFLAAKIPIFSKWNRYFWQICERFVSFPSTQKKFSLFLPLPFREKSERPEKAHSSLYSLMMNLDNSFEVKGIMG